MRICRLAKPHSTLDLVRRSQHHPNTALSVLRRVLPSPTQYRSFNTPLLSCQSGYKIRRFSTSPERRLPADSDRVDTPEAPDWLREFTQHRWYGFVVYRTYYGDAEQWARVQEKIYELTKKYLRDEVDEGDGDFAERTKDMWRYHWVDDRAMFEGADLKDIRGHFEQLGRQHMDAPNDRISWYAALVVDKEAFDSIVAAIEDPAGEPKAFVWAADPETEPEDGDEWECGDEDFTYVGHYKIPVRMLGDFHRVVSNPDWGKMFNGWDLALDSPWYKWRQSWYILPGAAPLQAFSIGGPGFKTEHALDPKLVGKWLRYHTGRLGKRKLGNLARAAARLGKDLPTRVTSEDFWSALLTSTWREIDIENLGDTLVQETLMTTLGTYGDDELFTLLDRNISIAKGQVVELNRVVDPIGAKWKDAELGHKLEMLHHIFGVYDHWNDPAVSSSQKQVRDNFAGVINKFVASSTEPETENLAKGWELFLQLWTEVAHEKTKATMLTLIDNASSAAMEAVEAGDASAADYVEELDSMRVKVKQLSIAALAA